MSYVGLGSKFNSIHVACLLFDFSHVNGLLLFLPCSDPPPEDTPAEGGAEGGLTDADISSNWDEIVETFDGMELPEELLRGIYSYGFEKPSAIQQRAIRPTISGRDLIAQAQSGTVSVSCFFVVNGMDELSNESHSCVCRNE